MTLAEEYTGHQYNVELPGGQRLHGPNDTLLLKRQCEGVMRNYVGKCLGTYQQKYQIFATLLNNCISLVFATHYLEV